jgi:hypothetical protein
VEKKTHSSGQIRMRGQFPRRHRRRTAFNRQRLPQGNEFRWHFHPMPPYHPSLLFHQSIDAMLRKSPNPRPQTARRNVEVGILRNTHIAGVRAAQAALASPGN